MREILSIVRRSVTRQREMAEEALFAGRWSVGAERDKWLALSEALSVNARRTAEAALRECGSGRA